MFDKKKFAYIIEKIKNEYETQEAFSEASGINRTYLSQYMNQKKDKPPTPRILKMLADASKGITTYDVLLFVCGYYEEKHQKLLNSLTKKDDVNLYAIPLFTSVNGELLNTDSDVWIYIKIDYNYHYFGYRATDKAMAPLLDINDIAIIQKKDNMEIDNGRTYLLKYENNIIIRRIIVTNDELELQATNPYYPPIKTTNEKIHILGRVIKIENESAFK